VIVFGRQALTPVERMIGPGAPLVLLSSVLAPLVLTAIRLASRIVVAILSFAALRVLIAVLIVAIPVAFGKSKSSCGQGHCHEDGNN
jgi:hypothetical protein